MNIKRVTAYEVNDQLFTTMEEAENGLSTMLVSKFCEYCYESAAISEQVSLINIINLLIDNNITSKEKLIQLKKDVSKY